MIKKVNVYAAIKVLFILIALYLIVILRADYYLIDTRRIELTYFTPYTFSDVAIRLLAFAALFAAGFNLKAALEKRLHLNKTRFILSIILLLLSLIDYYRLFLSQQWFWQWFWFGGMQYLVATRYLTLVVSAIAGYLCCSSFKPDDVRLQTESEI